MTNTTTDAKNRVACLYHVSTTKQVDHDEQNQADMRYINWKSMKTKLESSV